MARDPICGMYVDEATCTITSEKFGRKYYFCSEGCKKQFEQPLLEFNRLKKELIISWTLAITVLLITYFIHFPFYDYVLLVLASIVQFYPGLRFYKGTIDAIKNRSGNMDTLIALGTTSAWLFSTIIVIAPNIFPSKSLYFDTSSIIISLVLTGSYLESLMKRRASNSVSRLMSLQPKTAHIIIDNTIKDVPIENVKVGDIILIKPGENVPTDGTIIDGFTSLDESLITGESVPIDKKIGDKVIGGSTNTTGAFKMRAEKLWTDNTISEMIAVVEGANSEKVPIQRFADRVASFFVPAVLSVAIISSLYWYFIGRVGITFSILIFVTVLIIACPCALGIATPAALIVSSGMAAEKGILIKGGDNIEMLDKIDTVIFDKTGTMTKGELSLEKIVPFGEANGDNLIFKVAIAEKNSEHPIAKAILKSIKDQLPDPESFTYYPGEGVVAFYGDEIAVGNISLINRLSIDDCDISKINEEIKGKTILYISINRKCEGIAILSDKIKEGAPKAISDLKKMNIRTVMLTGDNPHSASLIAKQAGVDYYESSLKPEEKLNFIKKMQEDGKYVAMVGDGINDAPALVQADVGVAIGAGTDVAKETGGIILINSKIEDFVYALKLGKKTMKKIKQNLLWALLYNGLLIPVAAGILIPFFGVGIYNLLPFLAAIAMALSSTIVVSNSLLLRRSNI